jgi:hypothetical protein
MILVRTKHPCLRVGRHSRCVLLRPLGHHWGAGSLQAMTAFNVLDCVGSTTFLARVNVYHGLCRVDLCSGLHRVSGRFGLHWVSDCSGSHRVNGCPVLCQVSGRLRVRRVSDCHGSRQVKLCSRLHRVSAYSRLNQTLSGVKKPPECRVPQPNNLSDPDRISSHMLLHVAV